MEVHISKSSVEDIRPVLESWQTNTSTEFQMKPNIAEALFTLQRLVESDYADVLVLRSDAGRPLGIMGIMATPSPLNESRIAQETLFYVLPEHRGYGGLKLIRAAEDWARRYGCVALLLTASRLASKKHERTEKLYQKLGFQPFEATYIKEF